MSSRVEFPFVVEMQNEETLGGRLAKLPFGMILIILFTGALSYYFEHQPVVVQPSVSAAEQVIQRKIMERQSAGVGRSTPTLINPPASRWYWVGAAALMTPALAGVVLFQVARRRRNAFRQQRRTRS